MEKRGGLGGKEGFVGLPVVAGFRTAATRAVAQLEGRFVGSGGHVLGGDSELHHSCGIDTLSGRDNMFPNIEVSPCSVRFLMKRLVIAWHQCGSW